jgi:predicted dehydrogenase
MEDIFLIGTGPMALDYAKVLLAQGKNFNVIGRGIQSSLVFEKNCGIKPIIGGIDLFLKNNTLQSNTSFIIATGTEVLMPILKQIVSAGANKVLIEKPAAISIEELLENEAFLKPFSKKVFIAYNRRFYASVIEAKRLVEIDGGLKSMHFEFTEWAHKIEPLVKAPGVKENWFFANSTHVVDLAFYLAGNPADWKTYSKRGTINWHDKTNFAGAGITENGVVFSFLSNWESAGRWGIELLTNKRRIYLKPLEGIEIQLKGTVALQSHSFNDQADKDFKPGLYKQVEAFWSGNLQSLCLLEDHIENTKNNYLKILG